MVDKDICIGCYACATICPRHLITMKEDKNGFTYPMIVNKNECISCNKCNQVCPAITTHSVSKIKKAYAARNKNYNVRRESSSGGIFYLLAKNIIENNGIVFGARFDDDFSVVHDWVSRASELHLFQGSKYVQSNIGNSLLDAKKFLDQGRLVLFSGTPCQVAALKDYLGKDYNNLYTQEIMCYGVPAPGVWRRYIQYIQNRYKSKIVNISFRNKDNGWREYQCVFSFQNGKSHRVYHDNDLYMKGFIEGLYLRDACYECQFKGNNHQGDLVLADFWGIERICDTIDDNKGASLILILSEKGKKLFDIIENDMCFCEVDANKAIQYNPAFSCSATKNINRNRFYSMLDNKTIQSAIKHNLKKENLIIHLKVWIYRIVYSFIK